MSEQPETTSVTLDTALAMYRFYEEGAEKTKATAWAQATWILALNTGLLAFSVNLYVQNLLNIKKPEYRSFLLIEGLLAIVGVLLCVFLYYLLEQLGRHIWNYWRNANRIARENSKIAPFTKPIKDEPQAASEQSGAGWNFWQRLQSLTIGFMVVHVGWLSVLTYLVLS